MARRRDGDGRMILEVALAALGTAAAGAATLVLARSWRAGARPDAAQLFLAGTTGLWTLGALGLVFSLVGGWSGPAVRIWTLAVLVLAPSLCALAAVARHGVDPVAIRAAGVVLAGLAALRLDAAMAGDRAAVTTILLAVAWSLLCLDGHRQRVVLGGGALVAVFAAVAVVTVLPSPVAGGGLPDAGVPVPARVLPPHVVAFEVAARHVALAVVATTAVVGGLRGWLAQRAAGGPGAAWRAWGIAGARGPALAALLVPLGLGIVDRGTRGGDEAVVAVVAAAGLAVGAQLLQRGGRASRALPPPVRPATQPTTTARE